MHICGRDCPSKRFHSSKFDATFHSSLGLTKAEQAKATAAWGTTWENTEELWETDLLERDDPALYPWRLHAQGSQMPVIPSSSSSSSASGTPAVARHFPVTFDANGDRIEGWAKPAESFDAAGNRIEGWRL